MRRTQQKPIAMSDDMIENIEKVAAQKKMNFSEAVRYLLDDSINIEATIENQSLIRNFIHEEVNNSLGMFMSQINGLIEHRILAMCDKANHSSAITFAVIIGMLTENYTDGRSHEQILSVAIKYAENYLKYDPRRSELYIAEAREMLQQAYGLHQRTGKYFFLSTNLSRGTSIDYRTIRITTCTILVLTLHSERRHIAPFYGNANTQTAKRRRKYSCRSKSLTIKKWFSCGVQHRKHASRYLNFFR